MPNTGAPHQVVSLASHGMYMRLTIVTAIVIVVAYGITAQELEPPPSLRVRLGLGPVSLIAYSANGSIAIASGNEVGVYDSRNLALLRTIKTGGQILLLTLSRDGTLVAIRTGTALELWDANLGVKLNTLEEDTKSLATSFSPDGKLLASGGSDSTVYLWSVETKQRITSHRAHAGRVYTVAFDPDGRILASGGSDSSVCLWNVSQQVIEKKISLDGVVVAVAFSPRGKTLAIGHRNELGTGSATLWNIALAQSVGEFLYVEEAGQPAERWRLHYNATGTLLASGNGYIWDVAQQKQLSSNSAVISASFSSESTILAQATNDGVSITNVTSGGQVEIVAIRTSIEVSSLAFSPDGRYIASGNLSNSTYIPGREITSDPVPISFVALWDVAEQRQDMSQTQIVHTLLGDFAAWEIPTTVFSPDGHMFATAGTMGYGLGLRGTVSLWDLDQTEVSRFTGISAALSPDSTLIAVGRETGGVGVRLWNLKTGQQDIELYGNEDDVRAMAFSSDGTLLASGSYDGIRIWDIKNRHYPDYRYNRKISFTGEIYSIAYSPDGALLGWGSEFTDVYLAGPLDLFATTYLSGHTGRVNSVSFSPDGRTIASGSEDQTIRVWDIERKKTISVIEVQSPVTAIAYSPDGKILASGSKDGFTRLWDNLPTVTPLPPITLSDSLLEFGSLALEDFEQKTIIVTTTRDEPLEISLHISGEDASQFVVTRGDLSNQDGIQSQVITVTFVPTAYGVKTATLNITHNYPGPSSIRLSGRGGLEPLIDEGDRKRYITTVAGNGQPGFSGSGGRAVSAKLNHPTSVVVDDAGNIYFADDSLATYPDTPKSQVSKVDGRTGIITTIAGNGELGNTGDGGPALLARIDVSDLAVDGTGNVFIADSYHSLIRKVDGRTGIITTIAGGERQAFFGITDIGDGGPASAAPLGQPSAITLDGFGNIYIAEPFIRRVRKIDGRTGIINSVAGSGENGTYYGYSGEGGPALSARLSKPSAIAVDSVGNVYFIDYSKVFKVDNRTGIITTVAGTDDPFAGLRDDRPAVSATLGPADISVNNVGDIYIADRGNRRVRKVDGRTGIITTIAGNGESGHTDDGALALFTSFSAIYSVTVSSGGDIYVADVGNHQIYKLVTELMLPVGPKLRGDFDGDGVVGFGDFFLFADVFGGNSGLFDLDNSGLVDFADFFIFADNFGK